MHHSHQTNQRASHEHEPLPNQATSGEPQRQVNKSESSREMPAAPESAPGISSDSSIMRLLLQQPRSDIVFILDRDNKVRFVNRVTSATRMEDFVGSTGFYRVMPEHQALAAEAISRTRATGKVQIVEVQSVDGRWWQARTTLVPGHDPKLEQVLVICTDCTERRLAEEALQRSEERFDLAVRGSDAGIWDWNMVTGHTWYSPRCRSMLGYDDQEGFDGNHHAWNERIHPDDRKQDRAALRGHLAGQTPYYESQYRMRHKDDSYRWILARGMAVFDAQGKAIRIVGSHIDITAWKQAQEAVQAKQQILKRLLDVYEGHRKLAAYEIHDGLAQPLAGALMSLEAFGHGRGDGANIDWREYDRAVHLLRQSLAEARRLMSGMRPSLLDELGVIAAVESLVAEVEVRGRLHVELVCSVQFQRLAAPLETAVFRIVQESLINAERHSQSSKAAVCLEQRGDRIRLTVEDWGIGFDLERVRQDRFGLAGIRERAQLLGGQATIESVLGQGTRVTADLPLVEADHKNVD